LVADVCEYHRSSWWRIQALNLNLAPSRSKSAEFIGISELPFIGTASKHNKFVFMSGQSEGIPGGGKRTLTPMFPLVDFEVIRIHGLG